MQTFLLNDLRSSVLFSTQALSLNYTSLTNLKIDSEPVPVLFRSDWSPELQSSQVTLITGGGAGHEPAHAQYIGKGMLTAAVSGQIFASPSVQLIFDTIQAIVSKNGPGSLLIVKNYTGDRLNFGLACEMAKAKGIKARILIVEDDCAIEKEKGVTGRRGIAGTVLVHKIAGAISEEKVGLDELYERTFAILQKIRTIGVAMSSCAIPGRMKENRIKEGFIELGLGIHNEPGVETLPFPGLEALVNLMLNKLLSEFPQTEGGFIVLINNLGCCTSMELGLISREVHRYFEKELKRKPIRVYSGSFMTSFDMKGFSITLMEADKAHEKEFLAYLDLPVNAPGWSSFRYAEQAFFQDSYDFQTPKEGEFKKVEEVKDGNLNKKFEAILQRVAHKLLQNETILNEIDAKVGDGDCGSTLALGAKQILQDISFYPLADIKSSLECLTRSIEKSMGGTSGVIYRIFFTALASNYEKAKGESELVQWKIALEEALSSLLTYDRAREGHRTMLDSLIPAIRVFGESVQKNKENWEFCVKEAVDAAVKGAENTKNMKAAAGRSNYVPDEILKNYEDPGARATSLIWEGIYEGLFDKK